jgi:hypothetical protein
MGKRVAVHHFVANLTTRQYGPHPTSDLLGVDYVHEVPADTEFPRWLARADLFTRFYLRDAAPCEFFVRVWWVDHPRRRKGQMTGEHGPFIVNFRPDVAVLDHVFRIVNVRLPGTGLYELRLIRYRQGGYKGGTAAIYARTHFRVEK